MINRVLSWLHLGKPLSKIARASREAIPTQAIHAHRQGIRLATLNGLLVSVDPEERARCEARLAEVVRLRLGA